MAISRINSNSISDGTVIASDILDGTISSSKLVSANINGDRLLANTLSNTVFQTGSIENYMRGANLDFGMRNRIINGAMVIDQRNAGASLTPNIEYCLDRWHCANSQTAKFSIQRDSSANTVAGFGSSMKVTSLSSYSSASGDYFNVSQKIEGFNTADLAFGTASAKTITLSFWVRSSLTGTFGGTLQNSAQTRSYPYTYTIVDANTWEQKIITIPGDTSGTWSATTTTGLQLYFNLGTGTTYSGPAGAWAATNYVSATGATAITGTNGATFYITGVQLERGSSATGFEYRQYGTEFALCQRYYEVLGNGGIGSSTTNPASQAIAFKYQVTKRATPTITHLANYTLLWAGSATFTATATGSNGSSLTGFNASVTVSSAPGGTGAALVYITATDNISASAEL